jgi:hypothetical protein
MPRLLLLLALARPAYGQTLDPARILHAGEFPVAATALAPDGKTFVVADRTGLHLIDTATGKRRLDIEVASARALAISPDGKTIAAGDFLIHLFDLTTGKSAGRMAGQGAAVTSLAFFPDGSRLVSVAANGRACVWDVATRKALRAMAVSDHLVSSAEASCDGITFAVASEEGPHLYDAATGFRRMLLRIPRPAAPGTFSVTFSTDGRTLASTQEDHSVRLWEVLTGELRATLPRGHGVWSPKIAFSPGGRTVAAVGSRELTGRVRLWDLASDRATPFDEGVPKGPSYVRWGPAGRSLLVASVGGDARVFACDPTRDRPAFRPMKPADAWEALDGRDAANAYRAMWSLALTADGVTLLVRELKDVAAEMKSRRDRITRLIAGLDADSFDEREKAMAELARMGPDVYDDLDRTLKAKPPLEQHRRIERLLRDMERPANPMPSGLVRRLRGVEALEYAGTAEARATIERLTRAEDERLKASALGSLARLKK